MSVWISYAFIHLAYILLLFTPAFVRNTTNKAVLAFPLDVISTSYFLVVFIIGLIFLFLKQESYTVALIIQLMLLGIYAVLMLSHMLANEDTADSVERHEMELQYVRESSSQLNRIAYSIEDKQFRKRIEHLYDLLNSSPVKSNNSVRDYELLVLNSIDELEMAINNGDYSSAEYIINRIELNAVERNRRL